MAEPRSKRPRVSLPACPAHRPLPAGRLRQSFPVAVEEGLCGVTGALLELAYSLQALVRRRRAGGGSGELRGGGASSVRRGSRGAGGAGAVSSPPKFRKGGESESVGCEVAARQPPCSLCRL